jgi:hypothetical protein
MQGALEHLADIAQADVALAIVNRGNAIGERLTRGFHGRGLSWRPAGVLEVVSLPLLPTGRARHATHVRSGCARDMAESVALINERNSGRLFACGVREDDLRSQNVLVAEERGEICGVLAWQDLSPVRQTTIVRYPWSLWPARAAWGIARRLRPALGSLPKRGGHLRAMTVSHLAARNDDRSILRALVTTAMRNDACAGAHVLQLSALTGESSLLALRGLPRFHFRSDIWALSKNGLALSDPLIDLRIV